MPKKNLRATTDVDTAPAGLGAIIRGARQRAGMTLMQVSRQSRLSIGYLSQVERAILTPSVSALKRIADVLRIPAGTLMFEAAGKTFPNAAVAVVRRTARKRIAFPDSRIEYEMLTPDLKRRASLLWVTAPPGAESGPAFTHDGEDGVVVLKGRLMVEVAGTRHELAAGDSIYFNSAIPHRWKNEGKETVQAIWMSTPPSF